MIRLPISIIAIIKGNSSFLLFILGLVYLGILTSCSLDDSDGVPEVETGTLSIGSLDVRMRNASTTFARTESFSTWEHIFRDEVTLNLENTATGEDFSFVFNPNTLDPSATISLPYGFYRYSIESTGFEYGFELPFRANGVFELNTPSFELELNAITDYGLVTLSSNLVGLVSPFSLTFSNFLFMQLTEDGSNYYMYVLGGQEIELLVLPTPGSTIKTTFTINSYEHFHFELETPSEGNLSIRLVLEPFELIQTSLLIGAFRDIDGNVYRTTRIGSQIWSAKNLEVTRFRNGDAIAQATSPLEWQAFADSDTPAWAYYAYNSANGAVYGKMYNWHAVADPRGLAPEGYHIPTDAEWQALLTEVGANPGGPLKQTGNTTWNAPNVGATDFYGFSALGGGWGYPWGTFINLNAETWFWSASPLNGVDAFGYQFSTANQDVVRAARPKDAPYYVRVVRD